MNWNPNLGRYKTAMKHTNSWYTIRQDKKLIAFARVVSDCSVDAFIVDLNVRPEFQDKGMGKRLMRYIIKELKQEGVRMIWLTFLSKDQKLNHFYKKLGFDTKKYKAGCIDFVRG